MTTHSSAHILGLGFHVPEKVLTNRDLERMVETSDEWITSRTGIRERHIAEVGTGSSDLALAAARKALDAAGVLPSELTHIICPTLTPDSYTPSTACILEHKLGLNGAMAMDISAACSGFLYGLETARAILALHPDAVVLVVTAEVLTSRTNWADRTTCVLFGDGAGAAVLASKPRGEKSAIIMDVLLRSDGALGDFLTVKGGGSARPYALGETVCEDFFIQMQGRDVFKHAVRSMESVSREVLERNGFGVDQVDVCIPHQANLRIIEHVGKKLTIPEDKIFVNLDRYGNTSAASIPIALAEALQTGFVKAGDLVLLTTFGGGFTWGSALLRF